MYSGKFELTTYFVGQKLRPWRTINQLVYESAKYYDLLTHQGVPLAYGGATGKTKLVQVFISYWGTYPPNIKPIRALRFFNLSRLYLTKLDPTAECILTILFMLQYFCVTPIMAINYWNVPTKIHINLLLYSSWFDLL